MVSEDNKLPQEIEHQAQAYWDFMTQREREQYAWLAGIIDGEGYIGIRYHGSSLRLELVIEMTSKEAIDRIRAVTGYRGKILVRARSPKHKDMWRWEIVGQKVARVLRFCLPYLVVKRRQALCAIEFADFQKFARSSRCRVGNIVGTLGAEPYAQLTRERMNKMLNDMRSLNKLGKMEQEVM